jgi:hypothetical protein
MDTKSGPLPADTLDMIGALFYLRTLPLAPGKTFALNLFIGDKAVPATAQVAQPKRCKWEREVFLLYDRF